MLVGLLDDGDHVEAVELGGDEILERHARQSAAAVGNATTSAGQSASAEEILHAIEHAALVRLLVVRRGPRPSLPAATSPAARARARCSFVSFLGVRGCTIDVQVAAAAAR